jgi:V/A-type H+-transporting ATPase subunit D
VNSVGQVTTRSALLALREERDVVEEAYAFLDEKRLVLAAEILRQLQRYEALVTARETQTRQAGQALATALRGHGLQDLAVYPPDDELQWRLDRRQRLFMGVTLVEMQLQKGEGAALPAVPCFASNSAETCRESFRALVAASGELAAVTGNLYRLMAEYKLTERRARALENIILPELEQDLKEMGTHLEEIEQEDAIRVRLQGLTP